MITLDHVAAAIQLNDFNPVSALMQMAPQPRPILPDPAHGPTRKAGVLILLYPDAEDIHIVLTLRTENLRGHSGQISFPGGRRDATDESYTATALRETCEELGICGDDLTVAGTLTQIYIPPSHFEVFPTVATIPYPPKITPNPDEVAEVFTLPLSQLLRADTKHREYRTFNGIRVQIPYYLVHGHKVWGATAAMLSEFEHRLRAIIPIDILSTIDS